MDLLTCVKKLQTSWLNVLQMDSLTLLSFIAIS